MARLILCILTGLTLLCPAISQAAGTVAITSSKIAVMGTQQRIQLTLTCTGDASDGSFPATTINPVTYGLEGWYLYSIETNPGSTAPTDNWDIAITDVDGFDVTGGLVANRDTSNTEKVYMSSVAYPVFLGNWSIAITGNSVNSAGIVIKLVFVAN